MRVVERVETPAIVCRKCDRPMVGGTLPARPSLCGKCATNDARVRTTRHVKRSQWERRRDRFLDKWLPLTLQVVGGGIVAGCIAMWLARALGWAR